MKRMDMYCDFWCSNLKTAAAESLRRNPGEVQRCIATADAVCRGEYMMTDPWEMEACREPVCFGAEPGAVDWNYIRNGDWEWLFSMNRHTSFVNLAKAWLQTGNHCYADKFEELIRDWITRVPLQESNKNTTWRSLDTAIRSVNWLKALHLFSECKGFSKDLLPLIRGSLCQHGQLLEETYGTFHELSNWGILQDHGLYLLGICLKREEWCDLAVHRMDRNLHHAILRDGTQWEQSPMYHCEVLESGLDVMLAAYRTGRDIPQRMQENLHRMCIALAKWVKPNGHIFMQSDSDDLDARDLLVTGTLLFQDEMLHRCAGALFPETCLWTLGPEKEIEYRKIPMSETPQKSAVLQNSGNIILRGADEGIIHMHGGNLGGGHGHADLLHIDAAMGDEDILLDSGRYTYRYIPLRNSLKSPSAHNTICIDDIDFTHCKDSWLYDKVAVPLPVYSTFTEIADYAEGGFRDGYAIVQRKLIYLKQQNVLLIWDTVSAEGDHRCTRRFHFDGNISRRENYVHWRGKHAAATLLSLGNPTLTTEVYPYSRHYNELSSGTCLKAEHTFHDFGSFVTVLHMGRQPAHLQVEFMPVSDARMGTVLPPEHAGAVCLTLSDKKTVVIVSHVDTSVCGLLTADEFSGYGRALVFDSENPEGICLA